MKTLDPKFSPINLSIGSNIDNLVIDLIEILVRTVVDTTVNKVILKDKKTENECPIYWSEFINNINNNNDLERIIKTDVRYKSKWGNSYTGFDLFKNKLILWLADEANSDNRALRINGLQTFAVQVVRTFGESYGAPILKNKIVYTSTTKSTLFQGGFGVSEKRVKKNGNTFESINPNTFPFGWVNLKTPDYIVDQFANGTQEHTLGVIPAFEFLNKDVKDNYGNEENKLADWFPAKEMIGLINLFFRYFAWELNLDHTRVIGLFAQQDLKNALGFDSTPKNAVQAYNQVLSNNLEKESGQDGIIKKKLILKTLGSADSKLEVMNTQLKSKELIDGIGNLIQLFFRMSGYSWGIENNSVYENVSQTQNSNKGVYETTKEKVELFTRQWSSLLISAAYAYFKNVCKTPMTLQAVRDEFDKYVDFKIIANVLQEQNNDYKKTLEIFQAGLLSKDTALKFLYPEMTNEEIAHETTILEEQESIERDAKSKDMFLNQDNFGSENDKDNNDLSEKEPN